MRWYRYAGTSVVELKLYDALDLRTLYWLRQRVAHIIQLIHHALHGTCVSVSQKL